MTQSPDLPISRSANPYVGPRTFAYEQRHLFFGREREARDLLARVLSERLLLFYAQSGAGKSSLLRTRLIPQLQEERGFVVLPVGRVSGELPAGVGQVDNIFVFNLLLSIDEGGDPARLARITLADFLARLTRQSVTDPEGGERKGWVYDAAATPAPAAPNSRRYALVVDQFEEIITSHPGRWREREAFFRQLDGAMRADPNLWVVLTLREDYVAALDPYAPFIADRLRARFYMERMGVAAALDAIRKPAEVAGRPFAEGVAEKLADNLRQVRVAGQEGTVAGQYVEPVQLQVVCYQLWEGLGGSDEGRKTEDEGRTITFADLERAGDVDRALTLFYEETLDAALADPDAVGVSERQLRSWFDQKLITEEGTRGLVHQGESDAGGLPNGVVAALQRRFLVRAEARGGDAWIELVHDRFVEPIRQSNRAWLGRNQNPLTQAAQAWQAASRDRKLLYSGRVLQDAQKEMERNPAIYVELEQAFLNTSRREEDRRITLRQRRIAVGATGIALLLLGLTGWALWSREEAQTARMEAVAEATRALNAEATAFVANTAFAAQYATASAAQATAESERISAEASLAYALKIADGASALLTAQAPAAIETPGQESTALKTPSNLLPTPTFILMGTPTPDTAILATTQALQQQVIQLQETATAAVQATPQAAIAPQQQIGFTTTSVNLRDGPGTEFRILSTLQSQATVTILGEEYGWYQVQTLQQTGYVRRDLITFTRPEAITPTNTAVPSSTDTPPSVDAGTFEMLSESCPEELLGEFGWVWTKYKNRLGCSRQMIPTLYGRFAQQRFENGFMLWSEKQPKDLFVPKNVDLMLVFINGPGSVWYRKPGWSFVADSAVCAEEFTPPTGRVQPIRAFGGVWCDDPGIREAIGWGIEPERSIGGAVQEFDNGFILRDEDQSKAYVLFADIARYVIEEKPIP